MNPNNKHRNLVALHLPGPIGLLLAVVRGILLAMAKNTTNFPNPTPALATVDGAASDLEKAQSAVKARTPGAKETRDAKRAALLVLVRGLAAYVQSIADAADPANAGAIIASAAMAVHKAHPPTKRGFAVKQGHVSGSIDVEAPRAARSASYEWQWSLDGGKTWQSAPSTSLGRMSLSGLPAGATVFVRHRANTKTAEGVWSAPISFLVS
jgi:hypothetical protein